MKQRDTTETILDQYYTKPEIAQFCIQQFFNAIDKSSNDFNIFIEPSVGTGAFLNIFPTTDKHIYPEKKSNISANNISNSTPVKIKINIKPTAEQKLTDTSHTSNVSNASHTSNVSNTSNSSNTFTPVKIKIKINPTTKPNLVNKNLVQSKLINNS